MNVRELRSEAHRIIEQQRKLTDRVIAERRSFRSDEDEEWERLDSRFNELRKQLEIEKNKYPHAFQAGLANGGEILDIGRRSARGDRKLIETADGYRYDPRNYNPRDERDVYNRWLQTAALEPESIRLLQGDSDIAEGFAIPERTHNQLVKALDDQTFIRRLATMHYVDSENLKIPILANRVASPEWIGEISESSFDSTMSFESVTLTPHRLSLGIKASRKFLRLATIAPESLINQELAYKAGIVIENSALNGTGANEFLGVFEDTSPDITDCSTHNTTTNISADNLIECVYSLKPQYLRDSSLRWIFSRTALKQIRKLKDGEGNYLWQSGLDVNTRPTILSIPYEISEYCPDTFSSGNYVGVLGCWRFYHIAESRRVEIDVLRERFLTEDLIAFLVNYYGDGQIALGEAFVRVTLG
jgi:HK97 family phage major capsid protein